MGSALTLSLVALGVTQAFAFIYLWRTNRRIDALSAEVKQQIEAASKRMDETSHYINRHLQEFADEMSEQMRATHEQAGEPDHVDRIAELGAKVLCIRTAGRSRRLRRSDHRQ